MPSSSLSGSFRNEPVSYTHLDVYKRQFESFDSTLAYSGQTLGLSNTFIFWRIRMPYCRQGILAGAVLAFARALGEYGATSMLIGYTPGRTATISTSVYQYWRTGDDRSAKMCIRDSTQMFDSVKIGLSYLAGKCDAVLFTPVDIPLFTVNTVRALLESGFGLACPMCSGRTGHPILICSNYFEDILADSGEGGLKGALERCGCTMKRVPVKDAGTLYDADTPEDYSRLLKYHNSQLIRPEASVTLSRETPFFDKRMAMLLMLTDETQDVYKRQP